MVDVSGAWVIGNHGLELLTPDGILTVRPEVHEHEASVAEAARALAPLQQEVPGAIVENKRWSLSVHYRLSAARAVPMLERRAREIAQTFGLRVTEGKMIIELRPPVPLDKGTAALALAEQVASLDANASVFLAGDDQTDEDAFRALRRRLPHGVTARILSDTDAADTPTDAEFILRSPDELRQVLEWLVTRRKRA